MMLKRKVLGDESPASAKGSGPPKGTSNVPEAGREVFGSTPDPAQTPKPPAEESLEDLFRRCPPKENTSQ